MYSDAADFIELPASVLDAENWEIECQRLLNIRHQLELEREVQYYRNCIASYHTALASQTANLAEAEQKLLAFLGQQE